MLECFVCGSHRSKASIREEARRRREKKLSDFSEWLYSKAFSYIKIAGIVVGSIFVIACIIRIIQGDLLVDLETNTNHLIEIASTQIQTFVFRLNSWDVNTIWNTKTETLTLFIHFFEISLPFGEIGLSMIMQVYNNCLLLISNCCSMLPNETKFEAFSVICDKGFHNVLLIWANACAMCPSIAKFEVFYIINNKLNAKAVCFKELYDHSLVAANSKVACVREDWLFIINTVRSNAGRGLATVDCIFQRGILSIQSVADYFNHIISNFKNR